MNRSVLGGIRGRWVAWLLTRWLLVTAALVAGLGLALLLADAAFNLSDDTRAATPWLASALVIVVSLTFVLALRRLRDRRMARALEAAYPQLGDRLSNAVAFNSGESGTPVGEFLRQEAIDLGRKAAANVHAWPLVRRGLLLSLAGVVAIAAGWLALIYGMPPVFKAVLPRFTDPHGDHPPYSSLKITVAPQRAEVLYGGQLEVRAEASGHPVDKLWLVSKSATNESRAVMFLAPNRSFFQTLLNLRQSAEYYVTDGRARSHRFPIQIRYTPQITLLEVSTAFPDYTAKPGRTAALTDEIMAVPEGTRIAFRVGSNRPLKDGELLLTPVLGGAARKVSLKVQPQNSVVAGEFTLNEATAFSILIRDIDGLACAENRQGRFNVLPDERPRLYVLEPGRDAVATPTIRVPVRVEAQDDYGVVQVLWLRGHNRSIERPFAMKLDLKNGPSSVEASGAFDLEKLGVRIGDVIEYYFEAADNYPKGPNIALSRLFRLQVISKEQYEQVLRQQMARKALFEPYFKLGAWLRRAAERARTLQDTAESSKADKTSLAKDTQAMADDLEKLRRELGKVAEQAIMFDVEQAFRTTLALQDTALGEIARKLKQAASSGSPGDDLRDAARALSRMAEEDAVDVTDPAQQIASVSQVIARADTFVKLARQESTLAQLLRRFGDKTNALSRAEQMEVQELAHQQRRIQEELRKMMESLPELLAQVPKEEQYQPLREDVEKFIEAVKEAKIDEDLGSAAKTLGDLDAMTGHALAQQAADKMDKLISKCNGLPKQGKMCLRFQPKIQNAMGNTLDQILAAMGAGSGEGGRDGYGLFNNDVALFGPNTPVTGDQGAGRGQSGEARARSSEQLAGDATDAALEKQAGPGRVRLQPNAKFPLRYRELVGEYFKAIAESDAVAPSYAKSVGRVPPPGVSIPKPPAATGDPKQ